jgi:hypothetical protein
MIPLGFSPSPVSRLSDTHFPLPSLHGHEELPRWRGPAPQSSYPDSRDTSPNRPSGAGSGGRHDDHDEPEPVLPPRKGRRR